MRAGHLLKGGDKAYLAAVGLILVTGSAVVFGQAKKAAKDPASSAISSEKVIRYVREKFGVSDKVVMSLDPFKSSPDPTFLSSAIEEGQGKDKKTIPIAVSKDGHCVVVGEFSSAQGRLSPTRLSSVALRFRRAAGETCRGSRR